MLSISAERIHHRIPTGKSQLKISPQFISPSGELSSLLIFFLNKLNQQHFPVFFHVLSHETFSCDLLNGDARQNRLRAQSSGIEQEQRLASLPLIKGRKLNSDAQTPELCVFAHEWQWPCTSAQALQMFDIVKGRSGDTGGSLLRYSWCIFLVSKTQSHLVVNAQSWSPALFSPEVLLSQGHSVGKPHISQTRELSLSICLSPPTDLLPDFSHLGVVL